MQAIPQFVANLATSVKEWAADRWVTLAFIAVFVAATLMVVSAA